MDKKSRLLKIRLIGLPAVTLIIIRRVSLANVLFRATEQGSGEHQRPPSTCHQVRQVRPRLQVYPQDSPLWKW